LRRWSFLCLSFWVFVKLKNPIKKTCFCRLVFFEGILFFPEELSNERCFLIVKFLYHRYNHLKNLGVHYCVGFVGFSIFKWGGKGGVCGVCKATSCCVCALRVWSWWIFKQSQFVGVRFGLWKIGFMGRERERVASSLNWVLNSWVYMYEWLWGWVNNIPPEKAKVQKQGDFKESYVATDRPAKLLTSCKTIISKHRECSPLLCVSNIQLLLQLGSTLLLCFIKGWNTQSHKLLAFPCLILEDWESVICWYKHLDAFQHFLFTKSYEITKRLTFFSCEAGHFLVPLSGIVYSEFYLP